jgi:threonine aldolase
MTMRRVDLRSDTVTKPTPGMRRAMAEAEVGDDVFGEDPTVRRLEEAAAERVGKEDALFVASGTMANLVSLLTHCGRGDEVILGDLSHTFLYEQGGLAALGGIHPYPVHNLSDGTIDLDVLEEAVRPDNIHFPRTRLVSLENTHNRCGGNPLQPAYVERVGKLVRRHDLKLHIDGARLFNAAVALGKDVRDLTEPADSLSFCLSKGLAAPVGSLVCGSREFVAEARRNRKVVGGGMRQAGVLAAAGLVALEEMVDRLAEDHANARKLAEGLAEVDGIRINPGDVKTNLVFFQLTSPAITSDRLAQDLKAHGVLVLPRNKQELRAVTNYHVTPSDIAYAVEVFQRLMEAHRAS